MLHFHIFKGGWDKVVLIISFNFVSRSSIRTYQILIDGLTVLNCKNCLMIFIFIINSGCWLVFSSFFLKINLVHPCRSYCDHHCIAAINYFSPSFTPFSILHQAQYWRTLFNDINFPAYCLVFISIIVTQIWSHRYDTFPSCTTSHDPLLYRNLYNNQHTL